MVETGRLNPVDGVEGNFDEIYSVVGVGDVETKFAWFGGSGD